jgi:hypothetical protein
MLNNPPMITTLPKELYPMFVWSPAEVAAIRCTCVWFSAIIPRNLFKNVAFGSEFSRWESAYYYVELRSFLVGADRRQISFINHTIGCDCGGEDVDISPYGDNKYLLVDDLWRVVFNDKFWCMYVDEWRDRIYTIVRAENPDIVPEEFLKSLKMTPLRTGVVIFDHPVKYDTTLIGCLAGKLEDLLPLANSANGRRVYKQMKPNDIGPPNSGIAPAF